MAKPHKQGKKSPEQQNNPANEPAKKDTLSGKFLDTLTDSLTAFSKLSADERVAKYGDQEFLDQYWEYFKANKPNLLEGLTKEELASYMVVLEKKKFHFHNLLQRADKLHVEFSSEKPEREVMTDTLKKFNHFCKASENAIPKDAFRKFSLEAGFDPSSCNISKGSKLQTVDKLYELWLKFASKENISLTDNQKKDIENLLCPDYAPVERVMVEVAITKIKKTLPNSLQADFDTRFKTPLTAFSALGDLRVFRTEWLIFLDNHPDQIDKNLAKKLDEIIVTNGDIKSYLIDSGKKFNKSSESRGFENWERYFARTFNKLATRQLFEEMKDDAEAVDKYIDVVGQTVKGFPPYVNEIFRKYPYHNAHVAQADPTLEGTLKQLDGQISELEKKIIDTKISPEEKIRLRKKRKDLRQQKEKAKWIAYTKYLATKDKALATVMTKLVDVRFDFSKLALADQQIVLTFLVKDKLNDLISRKAPELLGLDADGLKQFTEDLFDLNKKELTLLTREGPVHIVFKEKKFLPQQVDRLLSTTDLSAMNNLPLQFVIQPTPSSQEFFERGVLRGHQGGQLFDTFESKDGPVVLNDGYKVKLSKDGKDVVGYLSQYPPTDEEDPAVPPTDEQQIAKATRWYLYSQPVTDASQDRKRVTREGKDGGTPVVVDEKEEGTCGVEVLDRSFALNGEAIGSLIFAYVLGQQSLVQNMTAEKENELAKKLGKLGKFLDTEDNRPGEDASETIPEIDKDKEKNKESENYEKFMESWEHLSGYTFPEKDYKENRGFMKGTSLYINTGETALPPDTTGGNTWMQLEIDHVDKVKGTFKVKMHGGEFDLGGLEGRTKEIPMNGESLDRIKELLGKDIYKVPPVGNDPSKVLDTLKKSGFDKLYQDNFASTFDMVRWDNNGYKFAKGDFVGTTVASFGRDEVEYESNGTRTITKPKAIRYQVKYLANGKVKISHTFTEDEKDTKGWDWSREMDYANFILFVAGKNLEPQASLDDKKGKALSTKEESPDLEPKKAKRPYSINNIMSFFKTTTSKIKDGIKKYDEERSEELTDAVLQNGDRLEKFGKMFGGLSSRMGEAMETAGLEYYTTRDARIWKKIEKWQKYYEQENHYASFFYAKLKGMLDGTEIPKDIYKIPAMLLTIITKEKDPYARNAHLIGKGHRVNLILGKENQGRYLDLLNKKKEEMRQNSALNGAGWTVMKNEEIVKLEMQYIVSVIDGREHAIQDGGVYEKAMASKWSRAFANKLSDAAKTVGFGETDKKANDIPSSTTFEYAEFEYSRNVKTNKTASALPNLKAMAKLARTDRQREVFQMHITSGILSGYFLHTLDGQAQRWINSICRTRGYLPGLWSVNLKQQSNMQTLLDVYSKGAFSKGFSYKDGKGVVQTGYSTDNYTFGNQSLFGNFVHDDFKNRWFKDDNGHKFCKFLEMTDGNIDGKKLFDLAQDEKLSNDQRAVLQEYMRMGEETAEDIDKDVKGNPGALKGTPFTKCQTIVLEMMKYKSPDGFEGTASNEKAGPALFWRNVSQGLPTGTNQSDASVEFFMRKFMNRFAGCGFASGQQTITFFKRLTTVKEMYRLGKKREADDVLWYTINGMIIQGNSAGRDSPPKEFTDALDAFKMFFKNNLNRVLSSSIVTHTVGEIYAKDDDANKSYSVEDSSWEEYMNVVKTKGSSMIGLSQEEKQKRSRIREKYRLEEYEVYQQLDSLADSLEKGHNIRSYFRKYASKKYNAAFAAKTSAGKAANPRGISITNPRNGNQTAEELGDNLKPGSSTRTKTKKELVDDLDAEIEDTEDEEYEDNYA